MRAQSISTALSAVFSLIAFASLPTLAATSPAMEACSKQWADMKAAGKTEGKTWPSFWSQCDKDFTAKNGEPAAAPDKATSKKGSEKPVAIARDESDTSGSAQQKKDCDAKWDANKAKTGAHGWHDYFQFMSRCM